MGEPLAREGESLVDPTRARRSYYGVNKQKDGNNYVGFNVPVGRLFADDMLAMAHLAETYGEREQRRARCLSSSRPKQGSELCLPYNSNGGIDIVRRRARVRPTSKIFSPGLPRLGTNRGTHASLVFEWIAFPIKSLVI